MNQRIMTTRGNFNPLLEYAKLYRHNLAYLALAALAMVLAGVAYSLAAIHIDPFNNKKKIVLVSNEFEKTLEQSLRYTFVHQFKGEETNSSIMQKHCR